MENINTAQDYFKNYPVFAQMVLKQVLILLVEKVIKERASEEDKNILALKIIMQSSVCKEILEQNEMLKDIALKNEATEEIYDYVYRIEKERQQKIKTRVRQDRAIVDKVVYCASNANKIRKGVSCWQYVTAERVASRSSTENQMKLSYKQSRVLKAADSDEIGLYCRSSKKEELVGEKLKLKNKHQGKQNAGVVRVQIKRSGKIKKR